MDWLSVPTLLALVAVLLPAAWWCWDYVHSLPTISPTDASSGQRRVVLITGCDSGFGQLLTRRLDRLGYRVLASCLTKEGERELQASCSERVQAFSLDLLSPASIEAAKGVVEGAGGHLHALVLNSGLGNSQLIDAMPVDTFQRIMTVNFLGQHALPPTRLVHYPAHTRPHPLPNLHPSSPSGAPPPRFSAGHVHLTKLLLPSLLPHPRSTPWPLRQGGRVVVMTSVAGLITGTGFAAYAASKHALEAFGDGLRREMGRRTAWRLWVSICEPAFMSTPMVAAVVSDARLKDWERVEEGAKERWGQRAWAYQYHAIKAGVARMVGDPQLVVDAYVHAVTAVQPRMRYHPGVWSQLIYHMAMLPAGLLDRMFSIPRKVEPAYFAQEKQTSK